MHNLIKDTVKFTIIALFFGLLEIINSSFIDGEIYVSLYTVSLSDIISAILVLLFTLLLIRFGTRLGRKVKDKHEFIARLSKIVVWTFAFLTIFNNDNFYIVTTEFSNGLLSELNIYATRSTLGNYLILIEIILFVIPLIGFLIYFFKNLDNYIDLVFKKNDKGSREKNEELESKEKSEGN